MFVQSMCRCGDGLPNVKCQSRRACTQLEAGPSNDECLPFHAHTCAVLLACNTLSLTCHSTQLCRLYCKSNNAWLEAWHLLQNNIGAITNGGSSNVVFQANARGYITMYTGTTPPVPGTCAPKPLLLSVSGANKCAHAASVPCHDCYSLHLCNAKQQQI